MAREQVRASLSHAVARPGVVAAPGALHLPLLPAAPVRGDMSVATGSGEAAGGAGGGGGARVFFSGSGSSREDSTPVATAASAGQVQQQRRHQQGKVTVKYDRKELRKRLVLEEWIVEQLGQLYGCEVPGRGAWRVGGLPQPMCPHRNSPGLRLLGARCLDSGDPAWEPGALLLLSRVPSGPGAQRLAPLSLGSAAGPLDGCG